MKPRIEVGCSGFHYKDWKGAFYPEDVPQKKWLEYYSEHFTSVEINSSFYRMPKEVTVKKWHDRVPEDFSFTLKGSRYTTHVKRLKDPQESVNNLYHMADLLEEKLACILWQLHPNLKKDINRLKTFCKSLSSGYRNVIEFRELSWFTQETYDILHKYNIGYCILSAPDNLPEDTVVTADFAYVRFHGKSDWYKYLYPEKEMKAWSTKLKKLECKELFIYFNNDYDTNAIKNARQLKKMLL